jgi:chromosomal replication initiator protein
MNQFIKYLSKKYKFNSEEEWIDYQKSVPVKNKTDLFEYLLSEVCMQSDISRQDLTSKSRKREVLYARHILAYIMHRTGVFSLKEIGFNLGGRSHSTIINANDMVEDLLSVKDDIMYPLYLKIKHLINENNTSSRTMQLSTKE